MKNRPANSRYECGSLGGQVNPPTLDGMMGAVHLLPFNVLKDSQMPSHYRNDIDGLRAIAVIAVLIGHTFERFLPGGYLGVDVFFVISGFVITKSLLDKPEQQFRSFIAGFWLRRIKRLMPALLVCFMFTCIVLLFIDTSPKTSLITGATSLLGFSNFFLHAQELDYFSASVKYNAFTHTWSLGVEEQFYFLFPSIFWLALRFGRTGGISSLTLLMLTASLMSLTAFLALQDSASITAYYMMPLRFWEIGAGVVVALLVHQGIKLSPSYFNTKTSFGLLILLGAIFVFSGRGFAPGHLVAVALTVILLWGGGTSGSQQHFFLTNGVSRYVGNISYSLYLWHWPFLVFGLLSVESLIAAPFVAMASAFVAAVLSYHFVEQPVRSISTPIAKFRYFAFAFATILVAILLIAAANDYRKKLPSPTDIAMPISWANLPDSNETFHPACIVTLNEPGLDLKPDTFKKCTFANLPNGDQRMLWVLGDSHAGHLHPGLFKLRKEYGFGVHLVETPGNGYPSTREGGFWPRERLMDEVRAHWKAGDVVVLGRLLLTRTEPVEVYADVPEWLSLVETFAVELKGVGINLLLMGPPPMFQFEDVRACHPLDLLSCGVERAQLFPVVNEVLKGMNAVANRHDNVSVFDSFSDTCPNSAPLCNPIRKGVFTFRDRDHFSVYGAEFLMDGFRQALDNFNPHSPSSPMFSRLWKPLMCYVSAC